EPLGVGAAQARPRRALARELERVRRAVEQIRAPESGEQLGVDARPCSDVQDTRARAPSRKQTREEPLEQAAPPAIPPVIALDAPLDLEPAARDQRRIGSAQALGGA